MASLVRPDNSRIELPRISFEQETNTFVLSDEKDDLQYPFRYALTVEPDDDTYRIFTLYRKDVRNEDIYQVVDRDIDQRIGWIFPVAALTSTEHSHSSNQHFLKVAFKAFELLLKEIEIPETEESEDYYNTLEFLHPDTVILCLSNTVIEAHLPEFAIEKFYPNLYRFGFTVKPTSSPSEYCSEIVTTVGLRETCKSLVSEPFLVELFRDLIYELHPLIRFHVLYQVVEICLDKILLKELESLVQGVKEKNIYGREIRTKFENFEAEKKRINKLFNEYYQHQNDAIKADLESASRSFLASIGRKIEDNLGLADIFYLVRNAIVHDYRNTGAGREHLLAINEILPHFLCDLIVHYNEETPTRDDSVAVQEPIGQAIVEAAPPVAAPVEDLHVEEGLAEAVTEGATVDDGSGAPE
jgi:hypothetical protein